MGAQRFFQKGALFLFQKLIRPRSAEEDARRQEFILNILVLCSLALSLVCLGIIVIDSIRVGTDYDGIPWWIMALIVVIFGFLFSASRRGHFRLSAALLITLYLFPAVYMTLNWGIDLPQGLLTYALLIIMTSVLLGTRTSIIFTAFLTIFLAVLDILYKAEVWLPDQSWRAMPFVPLDGVAFTVTFAAIAAVSWLSNREIEKSLLRARKSEAELKIERDSLEVKVEERTHELRQAQDEKLAQLQRFVEFGRLASGLFHDLANPLTAVALNLESLSHEQIPAAGRAKQHLEQAMKATKSLEHFLATARKQLQTQELQITFDTSRAVEQVAELLSYRAKKGGISIHTKLPHNVMLLGNPLKFHQIVANILSNAIDAYDGLHADQRLPITVSLAQDGSFLTLVVQDRGCGMTSETQSRIFEPFFTTKSIEHGMGIGLSSARNIIEKDFHGSISFTSQSGQGTTFTVRFALNNRPATQ